MQCARRSWQWNWHWLGGGQAQTGGDTFVISPFRNFLGSAHCHRLLPKPEHNRCHGHYRGKTAVIGSGFVHWCWMRQCQCERKIVGYGPCGVGLHWFVGLTQSLEEESTRPKFERGLRVIHLTIDFGLFNTLGQCPKSTADAMVL
jgi:hypothetical protein